MDEECPYSTDPIVNNLGFSNYEVHTVLDALDTYHKVKREERDALEMPTEEYASNQTSPDAQYTRTQYKYSF